MSGTPKDFLITRKEEEAPAEEALFTWIGPTDAEDRFRFLVTKDAGDNLSVLPSTEGRFKKGLTCWRWDQAEEGTFKVYRTVKTTARRIDLVRVHD